MNIQISDEYVERLLKAALAAEAVSTLSGYWSHRLREEERCFGVSQAEFFVQLVLIYSGEVANGGHTQFFLNREKQFVPLTIDVLKEVGLGLLAQNLQKAADVWHLSEQSESCQEAKLRALDQVLFDHVGEVDTELLSFMQVKRDQILIPERIGTD